MDLRKKAYEIRKLALMAVHCARSGHLGGSLGIAEILAVLYFGEMNVNPQNPEMPDRDRFVLSKGHGSASLYAVLALRGFFPLGDLEEFRQIHGYLQGHPNMNDVPGVDMSTGSLGQGISAAVGMAVAAKLDGANYRVYSILGDGELQEGQVWEATMFAAHYKLDNLCAIVDNNGLQSDDRVEKVLSPYPIEAKFSAFSWNVISIDGHNIDEVISALKAAREVKDKPTVIIAKTIKGKGVSFMENNPTWHVNVTNDEQYSQALAELNGAIEKCGMET
ncbi:MAG: transketolase [Oscillospiraceae bacterium]|jgi:transketolase|nr:transketolase [Oscillospiraceae bacterium]